MNCTSCGRTNRPGARFCDGCGAALVARAADTAVARKVVTIVFADLIGSTALHERLDAESARRLMDRYYRVLHTAVEAHGGTVVKLLGDGVMAAFGVPRVAEDDAIRAVRAAVGMQQAFHGLAQEQRAVLGDVGLRVAVNTGEVVVSDDQADVVGDPVNVAARLQQEAHDGDVLIGESTRRLVGELVTLAPAGALALRGRTETVAAYRVVSLERPAGASTTPFVGRDAELRRLLAVFDSACAARAARLAVVLGSPGLGKSRIVDEIAYRLREDATVLSARCDAAGEATFAPLAEAVRRWLDLDVGAGGDRVRAAIGAVMPAGDAEQARIVEGMSALLAGAPAAPEETFFVVRRFLAALAATQPVVLVIDDLQWAEPLLIDLTEHLIQWSTGAPLLVLVAARPELREQRLALATRGPLVADVVTLGGLDAGAATRLAASVIGADELPAAVAGRVLATSEGNPLFVGELVRMLVQDGALKREGDRWTAGVELAALEMPPTIHALLAARIDRLLPEERTVLERAAVIGRQFSQTAVAHLLPSEAQADLDTRLESLRRSELIEPDAGRFLGEPALRFHHVLIRDAAYRRMLKGTRAELHGRVADWIETRAGATAEHDETIGWHLEQAHQHLRELGAIDEPGRAIGERAARHLAAAGRRALARDDLPLAASLLGRALDRLDDADVARADLALDWCEALLAAGDVGGGARAIAEVGRFTSGSARLRAWHTCFVGQLAALTDPQALRATADAVAAAAEVLTSVGDTAGEAKAHSVHATALARLGRIGAAEAALDRALAAARRARDRRRANAVLAGAPLAALFGPSPVTRASGRCLDVVRVLRITQGAPAVEAVALRCQAVLEALRGRADAARRMIASSRHLVEELGLTHRVLEADVFAGHIELFEGDAVAAERYLRPAYEGLRSQGLGIDAAQAAALLGRALLAQDRAAEAEVLSHESEALAGDDLKAAIAWRGVRAEALARRGEHTDAVTFARAAVDIAAATDALLDHADARSALATVLRAVGRPDEAAVEEARAVELWDAKGATLLADRARGAGARSADPLVVRQAAAEPLAGRTEPAAEPVATRFANTAARVQERFERCWDARDWGGVVATIAPAFQMDDRRALVGLSLGGDDFFASLRMLFAAPSSRFRTTLLATRGERLALFRSRFTGEVGAGGHFEEDHLSLVERDGAGRSVAMVLFDLDAVDAAYAELEDRWTAGEGAPYAELLANDRQFRRASAERDWDTVAALLPDDYTMLNHRRFGGTGARMGRAQYLDWRCSADDLHVRADMRIDHRPRMSARAGMSVITSHGTLDGGPFELPYVSVFTHDGRRFHSSELFDLDRYDAALARYEELTAAAPATRFANAATRSFDVLECCWRERDWAGIVALHAANMRLVDRRSLTGVDLEGADFLAGLRVFFDLPSRWEGELLATRGDRLALFRWRVVIDEVASGSAVIEFLGSVEVDVEGRAVASAVFDVEAVAAAYADLDARYAAGEGATYAELLANVRAFCEISAARDWPALARLLPEDFTLVSRRRLVGTEAPMGRAEYLATRGAVDDLGLEGDLRVDHVPRLSSRAAVNVVTWYGTLDGGAFEDSFVCLLGHDGRRVHAMEMFDLDQLDAALARYEQLSAGRELGMPITTAATRAVERLHEAWELRDRERFTALSSPGSRLSDRRKIVQLELDRDQAIDAAQFSFGMASSRHESVVLATRGDRLALARLSWEGSEGVVGSSHIEWLEVIEVDSAGDLVELVVFDVDDIDAAHAELDARFESGEAAGHAHTVLAQAFRRAFAERDWEALAALLTPDMTVCDHRLLGWEPLRGPAAYIQALASLVDLAPDVRLRIDHVLAMSGDRSLYAPRWVGTREGGAFEEPSVIVAEIDGTGRFRRMDQYDLHQLDEARAQFAAAGGGPSSEPPTDPLRIPPNAATRARDRIFAAWAARDWAALRALAAEDFRFEDRGKRALLSGDVEPWIQSVQVYQAEGGLPTREVLGAIGDRIVIERVAWTRAAARGEFEVEQIMVTEVDPDGRLRTIIRFDADDRRDAFTEAYARFASGEAAASEAQACIVALAQAFARQDWTVFRERMSPDLVFYDHRPLGMGVVPRDQWVESLRVQAELAPDVHVETPQFLAWNDRGRLDVSRVWGTMRDGGRFENVFLRLMLARGGRIHGYEVFDVGAAERALARFEELCA